MRIIHSNEVLIDGIAGIPPRLKTERSRDALHGTEERMLRHGLSKPMAECDTLRALNINDVAIF
jgi:hypothetical protein